MAISNEVKTGILVTISAIFIIVGTYFLKGMNLFSSEYKYVAYFDEVQGLIPSSTIQIKGTVVGTVSDVILQDDGKVKVILGVKKSIKLPQGTTASIFSPDLMSGKSLRLNLGKDLKIITEGATLPASIELGLMDKVGDQIDPVMTNVNSVINRLDSITLAVQQILNPQTQANIQNSVQSLEKTMKSFASLSESLNKESAQLAGILRNTNTITGNLANNSKNIDAVIENLKTTTDKISKADLDKTINSLQKTLDQTQALLAKINQGEGSLGMLANDKQMYNSLNKSLSSLSALMDDLKKHPSRYINIRVFGKAPKDNP